LVAHASLARLKTISADPAVGSPGVIVSFTPPSSSPTKANIAQLASWHGGPFPVTKKLSGRSVTCILASKLKVRSFWRGIFRFWPIHLWPRSFPGRRSEVQRRSAYVARSCESKDQLRRAEPFCCEGQGYQQHAKHFHQMEKDMNSNMLAACSAAGWARLK
jgi:hypothetical protein